MNHRAIYIIALIIIVASLPLSEFSLSVGIITLFINWILEWNFNTKFQILRERKSILIFMLIYMIHLVGVLYSSNMDYALHDLQIKLPLLLLPLIIGTSEPLEKKYLYLILGFFVSAVVVSSVISIATLFGLGNREIQSMRDISIFISHIRLSLFVVFSIFILLHFVQSKDIKFKLIHKMLFVAIAIWLILFLMILKALSGIVIFIILSGILIIYFSFRIKELVLRLFLQVSMLTIFLVLATFITHSIGRFYTIENIDPDTIEEFTSQGNQYNHDFNNKQIENGHYVWLYYCREELRDSWNQRSNINFEGADSKGQQIRFTLVRYLTSKGFRKDADGVKSLSDHDIKNIEEGISNYIFADNNRLYPIIYKIIWEVDNYRKGLDNTKHSVGMRFVSVKFGWDIFINNALFGVGTGDVQDEFNKKYDEINPDLHSIYRIRTHNQYLTFMLTFGIIGFLIIVVGLILPIYLEHKSTTYFFWIFILIALLSMINEDTLETHTGVSFFAVFYSLLLLTKISIGYRKI